MVKVLRLTSVFEASGRVAGAQFDPVGGMQTHTGELTRALDARGVQQTVVTTRPPGGAREVAFGSHARIVRLGVPVPVCRQFYSVPAAALVPRLARRSDLVHAHLGEDLAIVPLALTAAAAGRIPLVLTVHTSVRRTLRVSDARSALLKAVGGRLELAGERRADAVLTLTHRLRDGLLADGVPAGRIRVIPSGVNPDLFDGAAEPARTGDRVVFVGRLHPQKGVDTAVRALPMLPGVTLVLAGDGPDRAELARLAQRLGVADRVEFLGFVPHDRVPQLLADADLFVMPSQYEELGTAIVEAMASGVPVVASNIGGIPQLVDDGETGVLVPPGDPAELAAACRALLADPARSALMAKKALARTAAYQWPALADRVLAVYRELV
ncbi:glycosyltransferase family 4 protein [Mycobacterium sp. MYCO198283]|uniref:glycosyltransferase family 4 protein n=1 Tax=Mycobacterium sp. MYCO198283 TaxID=2883505 RepID=UPI001E36CFCD|nr:glycosyltransferase family 4 protein [Mycobacterium sp. MYCO198283]MCG5434122.1 glycosyltransferase family 4 protein [Mycobacterium sp. MYCO198283]